MRRNWTVPLFFIATCLTIDIAASQTAERSGPMSAHRESSLIDGAARASAPTAGGPVGPDVTFCQLFSLQQFGREGDVVGLSVSTTSWNVGNADLPWFESPDSRHPFIAQNLYRIKNDRFEQIGQSWLKHGYFALAHVQCGGSCTFEPGHGSPQWLGMNCTDTYSSFLNSIQGDLGPREEVNPWSGAWTFAGSHNSAMHSHDDVEHRLQVHDADLDPAQNAGATYYVEGYYVHYQDVNVMNSAAWKPVSVSGTPGTTWSFSTSAMGVPPDSGFAVGAWVGAAQTLIAEELPVVEGVSPDGRSILAAKATELGGGMWHYDYALLNIDMDRKISSFTVPIDPMKTPQNIGFHAVESHGESYSNDPWTPAVTDDCAIGDRCVAWSTVDNPLRWGTVYNFRFDIASPPEGGATASAASGVTAAGGQTLGSAVAIGLFEAGGPATLVAVTVGPALPAPIPAAGFWAIAILTLLLLSAGTIRAGRAVGAD